MNKMAQAQLKQDFRTAKIAIEISKGFVAMRYTVCLHTCHISPKQVGKMSI